MSAYKEFALKFTDSGGYPRHAEHGTCARRQTTRSEITVSSGKMVGTRLRCVTKSSPPNRSARGSWKRLVATARLTEAQ